MLDNNNSTSVGKMLPIEILADAKVEAAAAPQKEEKPSQKSNSNNKNKTKIILNWLKNTTNSTSSSTTNATATKTITNQRNNSDINSCHRHNQLDDKATTQPQFQPTVVDLLQSQQQLGTNSACAPDECTCSLQKQRNNHHHHHNSNSSNNNNNKSKTLIATSPHHTSDDTLREFRGVQTLKHLWNKRITANKESALRAKIFKQQQHFTKSQSCLLTTSHHTGEPPPPSPCSPTDTSSDVGFQRCKLRAQSLHDCSQDFEDLTSLEIQKHLEKDNFYKYKTAEQASKLRELSEHSVAHRFSTGLILPWVQSYQKAERLQWLKRPDIFSKRKAVDSSITTTMALNAMKPDRIYANSYDDSGDLVTLTDIVINDTQNLATYQPQSNSNSTSLPRATSQTDDHTSQSIAIQTPSNPSTPTSPQYLLSPKRARRQDSLKTPESNVSRNSSTASLATSSGRPSSVKRSSSTRKYSFKTHSRSYHGPRRMLGSNKEISASSSASNSAPPPSSLVAKLTQQFNEIIQHDKSLLDEVKRKNGVLMTHKGHIYKVVETGGKTSTHAALTKNSSSKGSTRSENESNRNTPSPTNSSSVQKTIKKFENVSRSNSKPKIPLKSLKVLKKSNELVITTVGKPVHPSRLKQVTGGSSKQQTEIRNEIKPPQTLALRSTLEMVKEEAKTPIEQKDINEKPEAEIQEIPKPEEITTAIESKPIDSTKEDKNPETIARIETTSPLLKRKSNKISLEHQDSFFVEIKKREKEKKSDESEFRASGLYRKVRRNSSIVVEDTQRDIILYINEGNKNRDTQEEATNVAGGQHLSRNSSNRTISSNRTNSSNRTSSPTLFEEEIEPFKPTDLEVELAKEITEKIYSGPKFTNTSATMTVYSELQPKEAKHQPEEVEMKEMNFIKHQSQEISTVQETPKPLQEQITTTSPKKEKTKKDSSEKELERGSSTSPELSSDSQKPDDQKKSKTKHSKFYEKIFFTLSRKSQKSSPATTPNKTENVPPERLSPPLLSIEPQQQNYTPMSSPVTQPRFQHDELLYSPMYDPESKLLDALQQVDEKIHNLTKTETEIEPLTTATALVTEVKPLVTGDDYGQQIKPNTSFLHQSFAKDLPKPAQLIQAVNVTLVNAIEGEQMIMEQKEIQQHIPDEPAEMTDEISTDDLNAPQPSQSRNVTPPEEPLYEPIGFSKIEQAQNSKTEYNFQESVECEFKEEDIYQTVEELQEEVYVKKVIKQTENVNTAVLLPPPVLQLDDYEVIEDPNKPPLKLNCNLLTPTKPEDYDGYEECSPSLADNTPTPGSSHSSSLGIRKTTDELPDLPKPKRKMPKSPIPNGISPKPLPPKQPCPELPIPPTVNHQESHFYPGEEEEEEEEEDENIYDTIKGSHCYESLQSIDNKLQKSSSACTKISDSVSLSNCYESISHYKPIRPPSHHSASSHGSTLTISSENKTNSLYEDSLGSSLHYGSKRIYRRNTETHIEIQQSIKAANKSSGMSNYNASLGRASDTSDEWTDVSDNENEDVVEEPKLQFQIVRAKAHKSPDWSRRVRDKRLHHQRKSRSYIEDDDPDHYYEQLSPSALNKRHSLGLQERTGSLQRNQDMVRVSKRGKQISYSAHALGQQISDDSFDSDTDDYYESEHYKNAHNDSGVDIRTSKLPDPPASSNQMYAFVKKFKNFLANKKSPSSSKHGGSQQKIDDNTSQFYVEGNFQGSGGSGNVDQKKPSLQIPQTKELSTSEKNLILAQSNVTKAEQLNAATTPRKSKAGKSLRHRLRKSLVGFDSKQLATLTPTRSTFYVEEPVGHPEDVNGQLDSGFSEKAASGELPLGTAGAPDTHNKFLTARKSKKEAKLINTQRRRTTIGIRPIEPPPPPPDSNGGNMKRQSNTSWYAECGVFKNGTTNLVHDDTQLMNGQNGSANNTTSGSSWYEEAGLYQTSGVSVASSSGSSGVSTSNEASPADEMSHSLFSNEPLYQIYSAAKLEAISRDMHDESSTDGYEEIGDRRRSANSEADGHRKSSRPTALQLVEPKSGPERTLWSQIPEVVNSMIIPTMTPRERALMEAKFEIITSEASYLKSLNLLRNHYMNHPVFRDQNLVNSRDRKSLFAHIVPVHECSERLLSELESCWQDNIMLIGLSKRIYAIAEKHFHVYIGFCEHQGRMDRTLKSLRAGKGLFSQNLELLESSAMCCGLNLHSFLMLPMQRITRLPLLIDAVFSKCHPNDDEYENWKMCLAIMNKIVTQCNEAATKSDQAFEIEKISRQLEFNPSVIRPLAIAPAGVLAPGSKPRFLVKKGEFTHLIWRGDDAKLTFGKKFSKTMIYAFLFSDLLVLTKRKGEEQFSVFDYCPRNMLTITSGDSLPQVPTKDLNSQTSKNLILMTLLENHQRKTNELLLSCPSVSEQERWLQAMRPPESETPGEKLYEQWDCPQVVTKHLYENNEPDGLNLEVGDVVNVTRKLPDGWYKGERIRDGVTGWFPGSYTEEVNSAHVRARNLKLRHRLLTFTATYLESQKRNK